MYLHVLCMVVCFYRYNNKRGRTSTMLNINIPQSKYKMATKQPAVVYLLAKATPVNPHDFRLVNSTALNSLQMKATATFPDTAPNHNQKRAFIEYKCGNCQKHKTLATGHCQQKERWWCPRSGVDYRTRRAFLDK